MTTLGYARVSSRGQDARNGDSAQRAELERAGATRIFSDVISGSTRAVDRPGMAELLAYARDGEDRLAVYSLSRLGRDLADILSTLALLESREIAVVSITEAVDTSTSVGRLTVSVIGAVGQWEKEAIQNRVQSGVDAAKARGVKLGRPRVTAAAVASQVRAARLMQADGATAREAAAAVSMSRAGLYRAIALVDAAAEAAV